MLIRRSLLAASLAVGLIVAARAQTPPIRVRAVVVSLEGDMLTVASPTGEQAKLAFPAATPVTAIIPSSLDQVKSGSYVGTAARPGPNGTLVAIEIQLFPEAMRGVGEGHRPWDLGPDSSMTNGTVGNVVVSDGRTLTVGYQGGQQIVTVPANAPVITFEPGSRGELVPGAHVIVFATKSPDGKISAGRVLVGKNGLVPPM